jgi:glucose-1-phosphate adenylyltransferase
MDVNNKVLGLIFASLHDSSVVELTKQRTMGSILFGGRYRLIDFPLSNMVNSGVSEVGVITKSNYGSLMDHLGSGREWDLARKMGGLHLLPPFSHEGGGIYRGRLEALNNVWSYVENASADYIILADCDVITTINYREVIEAHLETGAEITVVYAKGIADPESANTGDILQINEDGRVAEVLINPQITGEVNKSLDMFVISKEFLKQLVKDASAKSQYSFVKDIIQAKKDEYKIYGFEHKGYYSKIDSIQSYYKANLRLLDFENRTKLFTKDMPIYTKVRDNAPVKYGLEAEVKNSTIADGCVIEGEVENSVLFRGVKVEKGAVVKNCVLQQGTLVGAGCAIDSIITDKNVEIGEDKVLTGSENYPLYISKNAKI